MLLIPLTFWMPVKVRGLSYFQRFGLTLGVLWIGLASQCVLDPKNASSQRFWLRFGVSLTQHFALGPTHVYYDHPHCSFSLGWLHFIWEGHPLTGDCAKCDPTPHPPENDEGSS